MTFSSFMSKLVSFSIASSRVVEKSASRRNNEARGAVRKKENLLFALELEEVAPRMRQKIGLAHPFCFFRRKFWLFNKCFLGKSQIPRCHFVLALERQSFFRFSHVLLRGSVNDASVPRSCIFLLPPLWCAVRTFPRRERNAHFCGLSKLSLSHVSSRFLKHRTLYPVLSEI